MDLLYDYGPIRIQQMNIAAFILQVSISELISWRRYWAHDAIPVQTSGWWWLASGVGASSTHTCQSGGCDVWMNHTPGAGLHIWKRNPTTLLINSRLQNNRTTVLRRALATAGAEPTNWISSPVVVTKIVSASVLNQDILTRCVLPVVVLSHLDTTKKTTLRCI